MPRNAEKLLEQMRKSKNNWKINDLKALYRGFGFIITGGGPHDTVQHPEYPSLITFLPRHRKVALYSVNQAISLIDKLKLFQDEKARNSGDET
jgi:hypothetical protein